MHLFPDSFVRDVQRLKGSSYSFVRHVCSPAGAELRDYLERRANEVPPPLRRRWADMLTSLDNRRFFQGFSEAVNAELLLASGWKIEGLTWPGPTIPVRNADGQSLQLLVLAFVRQVRPGPDRAVLERLVRAINRVGSTSRIVVLVKKWLPHDFDAEPVRRAVDLWLTDVDHSQLVSRHATYDDEHVSLEFTVTNAPGNGKEGVVLFSMGPFLAQRTIEILETRLVYELDAYRLGAKRRPVVIGCVANQPWGVSDGYLRELLLGKPLCQVTHGDPGSYELTYGPAFSPSLFRDPLYGFVAGVIMSECGPDRPLELTARAYLNPWATEPLAPASFACDTLARHRDEEAQPVLRWFRNPSRR